MTNIDRRSKTDILPLVLLLITLICTNAFSQQPIAKVNGELKQLKIAFVTGNEMKAREIQLMLSEHSTIQDSNSNSSRVELKVLNVDLPEIQEVNTEGIAKAKAILGAQLAGGACVVEDTSLHLTALGGMPGPYIKWFDKQLGAEGLYKILNAFDDKSATAVCTLAFCSAPHDDPVMFTGEVTGRIVAPVEGRGERWDSVFVPDGAGGLPFSCLSMEKKNRVSHRGQAVKKWADWLGLNFGELLERQSGKRAIGHKGLDFKVTFAEQ